MAQKKQDSHDEVVARRHKIDDPQPHQIQASIDEARRIDAHRHNLANRERLEKEQG